MESLEIQKTRIEEVMSDGEFRLKKWRERAWKDVLGMGLKGDKGPRDSMEEGALRLPQAQLKRVVIILDWLSRRKV